MSKRSIELTEPLYRYLLEHSLREPSVLRQLREQTAQMAEANMQIAPEQGQFMRLLVQLTGALRAIEIGTFTGYSALCIAEGMGPDGHLVCCDTSVEWTDIAKPYWQEAGVDERIDLRIAPAAETLDVLLADGQAGTFDFAFIDADKTGYDDYYEHLLLLLRAGGLIVVDNVLWDGAVADPSDTSADTVALRAFNKKLHGDERVELSMIPVADGLTLVRKLPNGER